MCGMSVWMEQINWARDSNTFFIQSYNYSGFEYLTRLLYISIETAKSTQKNIWRRHTRRVYSSGKSAHGARVS